MIWNMRDGASTINSRFMLSWLNEEKNYYQIIIKKKEGKHALLVSRCIC